MTMDVTRAKEFLLQEGWASYHGQRMWQAYDNSSSCGKKYACKAGTVLWGFTGIGTLHLLVDTICTLIKNRCLTNNFSTLLDDYTTKQARFSVIGRRLQSQLTSCGVAYALPDQSEALSAKIFTIIMQNLTNFEALEGAAQDLIWQELDRKGVNDDTLRQQCIDDLAKNMDTLFSARFQE